MAASRTVRFACIGAVAALGLTLAYWLALWSGGPVWIGVANGHDGGLCYATVTVPKGTAGPVTERAPCGVSLTARFVVALCGMLVALALGVHALVRDSRRTARWAAWSFSAVGAIVAWETAVTYAGDGFADGLGPVRGPIHLLVVFFAAGVFYQFARAPRNPESVPPASVSAE